MKNFTRKHAALAIESAVVLLALKGFQSLVTKKK